MSPEQCLGEDIDKRSDIYSLGIVLYEMLAGIVPFRAPSSNAVVNQQVNQVPPPLRNVNPAVSPAAEAVVLQALAKKREDRPQSARALAAAFSAATDSGLRTPGDSGRTGSTEPDKTEVLRSPQYFKLSPPVSVPTNGQVPKISILTALMIVGAVALLAIGALAAVLLNRPGLSSAANTAATPQPTVDNARTASSPVSVKESSTPTVSETAPAAEPVSSTTTSSARPPGNFGLPDQFSNSYRGTIGKKGFWMTLVRSGDRLEGTASTQNQTDTLLGTIGKDGHFEAEGCERGGQCRSVYIGQVNANGTVTGHWTDAETRRKRVLFSVSK